MSLRETEKVPTARHCADGQTSGAVGTQPSSDWRQVRPSAPDGRRHRNYSTEGHRRHISHRRHRSDDADGHRRHMINRRYRPVSRGPRYSSVTECPPLRYGNREVPTALPSAYVFFFFVPIFFITEMTITHLINPIFLIYLFFPH